MKRNFFQIILSTVLIFAVTDYVWLDVFNDQQTVKELNAENEKESKESKENLEEFRGFESKHDFSGHDTSFGYYAIVNNTNYNGFVKHGSCFLPISKLRLNKIYLLLQRLRLDC